MNTSTHFDAITAFVFIGVFQGLVLSLFFIFKPSPNRNANKFQGLFLLSLTLCILEQLLNMTGYIVKVLPLTNSTEALNLVIGPFYIFLSKEALTRQIQRRSGSITYFPCFTSYTSVST
ncbi:MAG: hypothetical protein IPH69_06350 [Bacteroidales bacterium]|nr:hypothetical protein [Bacteroidales bacterium]